MEKEIDLKSKKIGAHVCKLDEKFKSVFVIFIASPDHQLVR